MAQNSKNSKTKQTNKQILKKHIQEKSTQQRRKQAAEKKGRCCFYTFGSLFLIVLIGGLLAYDTHVVGKGVFAQSATGKALHSAGLLPYVEKAWYTTMSASARGYKWAEKHVPPYVEPVLILISDLWKLARNTVCSTLSRVREYGSAKLPAAAEFLETYIPGLPAKIAYASSEAQKVFVDWVNTGTTFFKTNVFIGRFSPENLNKALNKTQNLAAEYYGLFQKKVNFYAKLK